MVFVDTASGHNVPHEEAADPTTPDSDLARVDIAGASAADPGGVFRGWLFVNGGLSIAGDFRMEGLAYAQNELSYRGGASSGIAGAVITRETCAAPCRRESIPSLSERARIIYDCSLAKTGANFVPDVWIVMPGTYREPCDSCTS